MLLSSNHEKRKKEFSVVFQLLYFSFKLMPIYAEGRIRSILKTRKRIRIQQYGSGSETMVITAANHAILYHFMSGHQCLVFLIKNFQILGPVIQNWVFGSHPGIKYWI